MLGGVGHGRNASLLTRMFLRDCAYAMRLHPNSSAYSIWLLGSLATSLTLSCFSAFVVFIIAVTFRSSFPEDLNPLTAPSSTRFAELIALVLIIGAWVDYRFREYKHDLSAAKKYMTRPDRIKHFITGLLGLACLAGIYWMIIVGGEFEK